MGFAERNGFVKEKTVQVDEIDRSLRNRLYNMVHVTTDINIMLEQEKSGYRLLNDKFVNIISEEELQEINKIIDSPYQSVKIHINKALALYSDRKKQDKSLKNL